ncbi:MAG TPA: hypothetical protein VKJ47_07855 [Candidatus Binatia bacterium]|nr:hypothetical protein [Candidatus Binatia bacterium]
MASPRSSVITATWALLNLLPLLLAALAWFVVGNWVVRLLIMVLYLLCIVPYGFFVAMPLMVRLFQHPASLHRR